MDDNTTISRAGPADLDALATLLDAYRTFYGQTPDLPLCAKGQTSTKANPCA